MLQTNNNIPSIGELETSSPTEVFRTLTGLVRRQRRVIIWSLAAMLFAGVVYILLAPPLFTAQTLVMLDPLRMQQLGGTQTAAPDAATTSTNVDSQIPLVRSKDIAASVIKALRLADNPEFASDWFGPPRSSLRPEANVVEIPQAVVESFERKLDVRRLGLTYVIEINFSSTSPEIAAQVSNQVAETYIREQQDAKYEAIRRASSWLKGSINELAKEASSAEQSFIDFKTGSDLDRQSQATFHRLESAAKTYRGLYENFLQRYGESIQQQSFPIAEARIVSRAVPPERRSHPRRSLVMAVAGFGGLLIGLAIAIARDLSDRVFRTGGQVEAALQTGFMSYVPALGRWTLRQRKWRNVMQRLKTWRRWRIPGLGRASRLRHPELEALYSLSIDLPDSRFAQAIRSIRLSMELLRGSQAGLVVGVTSALPGEGKSTIAINLARLLARSGARTLLVDCDLQRPELSSVFGGPHKGGLLATVAAGNPPGAGIWRDAESGLDFLPAGAHSSSLQPSEAAASDALGIAVDKLRQSYRFVILDLPAMLPVSDVQLTARFVDCYILVIEWGRTESNVIIHALDTARAIRERLVGAVLNKVEIDELWRYRGSDRVNRFVA